MRHQRHCSTSTYHEPRNLPENHDLECRGIYQLRSVPITSLLVQRSVLPAPIARLPRWSAVAYLCGCGPYLVHGQELYSDVSIGSITTLPNNYLKWLALHGSHSLAFDLPNLFTSPLLSISRRRLRTSGLPISPGFDLRKPDSSMTHVGCPLPAICP
ncbi:hypothetical protein PLICRDRAFT_470438 [Plicaturopsis crispa FD-325 SS-3]|nr:hypothetical protein PLICRDRAFT_470438 [Plicaturopsis crispa FD-325 SS-3]